MDSTGTPAPEKAADEPKADDGPEIAITGLADEGDAAEGGSAPAATRSAEGGAGDAAQIPLETPPIEDTGPAPEIPPPAALPELGLASPRLADTEVEIAPAPPAAATAGPATPWAPSTWFMSVSAFLVAAADLGTKEWAIRALAGPNLTRSNKKIEGIPGLLDFIFAQNPGGAWSFLRSMPDGLRRPFFLFVSSAAIVFIISVYRKLDRRQWAMRWGLPLALGGAIGNLADRVRHGWVVDFIDFYWKRGNSEMHWPTFNVADIAIVAGVGLMALDLFSLRKMKDPAPAPSPETAGGAV